MAASDWDGSDGLTLPQLWDTHTHEVKITNGVSQIDYVQNVDCLVPLLRRSAARWPLDHDAQARAAEPAPRMQLDLCRRRARLTRSGK